MSASPAEPSGSHPKETSPVALAYAALGTDLDDSLSRDPDGLFSVLRSDNLRIALFRVLARMDVDHAARMLHWIATHCPQALRHELLLQAGFTQTGAHIAAAARRRLFDRLLDPDRLNLVLTLCANDRRAAA